ncbi:TadE/TadG family type IV pilus assembly protein [Terriglobus sp. TAA 43]|uniref:TadE/TadG family type IV pilus assembly protein n=1 Tax=Terriglobus sp. TAA 43 TaxID=278961 RepID=UPI000647E0BF|nr:TadE/TadG family type IV pilus assembly protein [Terriglobus sp. TAA 43]
MLRDRHFRTSELFREETGNTLLETALCLSVVLLVILGIMECSLAVYTEHYVESAAASGARYAMVRGGTYSGISCGAATSYYCQAGTSDILNYIKANAAPGIKVSNLSVTASWPGTAGTSSACDTAQGSNSPGCLVTVTVSYPFTFMLPIPLHKGITLLASRSTIISQ